MGIANTNQKLMLQAASEFGLTPSARSRIMAGSGLKKEDIDEMEEILGGSDYTVRQDMMPGRNDEDRKF